MLRTRSNLLNNNEKETTTDDGSIVSTFVRAVSISINALYNPY